MSNCDSDSDTIEKDAFELELSSFKTTYEIDELIEINITSDENIIEIVGSTDNFETNFNQTRYTTDNSGFGKIAKVYLSFDTLDKKTIHFKIKNSNKEEIEKSIEIDIIRGPAVKIKNIKIKSFYKINETWDSEFGNEDVNRLADVIFGIRKGKFHPFDKDFNFTNWFISNVKENQGDLTWSVSSKNLYLNPNRILKLSLVDDDGNNIGESLIYDTPYERDIDFKQYTISKPNFILYKDDTENLEIELELEWP